VTYDFGELDEVSLAYAVTIQKLQGSEFPAVEIPVAMHHYMLLKCNLTYTGSPEPNGCWWLLDRRRLWGSQ
jgi:exodeoxyribonuclease V alpha subunit